jgi:glutamine amidotransferase
MTLSVSIVDYDCGNLRSLQRALITVGATSIQLVSSAQELGKADRLILPGVGAFGHAIEALKHRGLFQPIIEFAVNGRPLLGICLGMQLLFDESDEMGRHAGLGLIPGTVTLLDAQQALIHKDKVPNIGWLPIRPPTPHRTWDDSILAPLSAGAYGYFNHSYAAQPDDSNHITAVADHGGRQFCAATSRKNVFGCQFHPEKSAVAGLNILRHFLAIAKAGKG